ncbi:hypothetical protein PMAYCL1PPCAC_10831, partial [Pristionchus mayeri]
TPRHLSSDYPEIIDIFDDPDEIGMHMKKASTHSMPYEMTYEHDTLLDRPPMNQERFDHLYGHKHGEPEARRRLKKTGMRYIHPFTSCAAFKRFLVAFFPILQWLPHYSFKSNIIYDILGGITVGVMNVPQGIAYASLAGLPAVCGLYVSFLPPLVYLIFGTSRHNSISAFSVVCLMTGLAVERFTDTSNPKYNETVAFIDDPAMLPTPTEVATSLTMLVAFINLAMALLRLEFLMTYLSDQVVSAFTTAATVHVLVSQIPDALGITGMVKHDGENGYLVMNLYEIIIRIPNVNLYTCGISLFSIVFLLLGKEVVARLLARFLNFHYALPYELLLIIITTVCSYFIGFSSPPFNVKTVGSISTGLVMPTVPRFDLMPSLIGDALTITLVAYALHISLGRTFAKNHDYELDDNQELLALGFMSAVSSFFPVYPPACSLSRSVINNKIGTKTPLSNFFAAGIVLSTILFLATYLEPLPKPVLSCIVLVALYAVLLKFKDLIALWPVSKIDFSIWAVSFLATVFIDVTPGLIISMLYALFTAIAREQWPLWHLLGGVHGNLDFEEAGRYQSVSFFQEICLFRFDSPLLFMNAHRFKKCVQKALRQWEHENLILRVDKLSISMNGGPEKELEEDEIPEYTRHLVIDCSGFTFVDYMGISTLKELFLEMHNRNVLVYFAAAKAPVRDLFARSGFHEQVPKSNFYPTMRDAVAVARTRETKCAILNKKFSVDILDGLSEVTTVSM